MSRSGNASLYRILVSGSRDWADSAKIRDDLDFHFEIANQEGREAVVVHGGARGADTIAAGYAHLRGVHTCQVAALWGVNGRAAGPVRNEIMADLMEYDAFLAYPLPQSKGTDHMISLMYD